MFSATTPLAPPPPPRRGGDGLQHAGLIVERPPPGATPEARYLAGLLADGLAQAFIELRLLRLHNWRTLSRLGRGEEPGPESSVVKLAWTDMTQHLSATALDVLGPAAPLWGSWPRQHLWSFAASIAGVVSLLFE